MNAARVAKHLQCIPPADIISLSRDESVSSLSITEAVAIAELVGKLTSENGSRSGLDVIGALMMNVTNSIQTFRRLPTSEEVRLCCRLAHIDDEAAVTQVQYLRLFDIFKRLLIIQAAATTRSEATDQMSAKQRELSSEVSVTVSAMCTGTPFLFQGNVLPIEIVTHLAAKFGLDASRWFQAASSSTMLPTSSHVVRALEELMVQGDHDDEALLEVGRQRSQSANFTPNLRSYDSQAHKLGSRPQQQPVSYISVRMMTELFTPVNDKLVHVFRTYFGAHDPNDPHGVFGLNDLVGGHLSLQLSLLAFRNKLGISEKKLRQVIIAATEQHAASQTVAAPSPAALAASLGGGLESRRSIANIEDLPMIAPNSNADELSPSIDRKRLSHQQPLYDDQPYDAETIFTNGYIRYPDFECIVRFLNDDQNSLDRIKADQRAAAEAVVYASEDELMAGSADAERLLIDAQTAMIDKMVKDPALAQQQAASVAGGLAPSFLLSTGSPQQLQQLSSQMKSTSADPTSPSAVAELPKVTPSGERLSPRVTPAGKEQLKVPIRPQGTAAAKGTFRPQVAGNKSEAPNTQTIFISPNTSVQWHAQAAGDGNRPIRAVQQKVAPVDLPPLQLAPIPQLPPHIVLRGMLGRNAQNVLVEETLAVVGGVDLHHSLTDLGPKTPLAGGGGGSTRINAAPEMDLLEEMELENDASHLAGRSRGGVRRRSIQLSQASDEDAAVLRNSVGEAATAVAGALASTDQNNPAAAVDDQHPLPALHRVVSHGAVKDQPQASFPSGEAAAALVCPEKPRWRNVKHISRYDGQDIAAYTAPTSSTCSIAGGFEPRPVRSVTTKQEVQPPAPKPLLPLSGDHSDADCRQVASARTSKKPQPSIAMHKKDPSIERKQRPATSDQKPETISSSLDPPMVASSLSPRDSRQASAQRNGPVVVASRSAPDIHSMLPLPPPRGERRAQHVPSLQHQQQQQRGGVYPTSLFPKEIGAEIWNVLGVNAVPDGFPHAQYASASLEVLRPRSDYNSLHSAVLSFNRYQMEAIRLR